jgi:adenosylcobinamide kinase/adenosylcobinamide-phosphate guanylyltransferase
MTLQVVKQNSLVLLMGGARSGKSRFAERCGLAFSKVIYFATAHRKENDSEMTDRIAKHRARRPASWITMEPPSTLEELLAAVQSETPKAVIVDCATLWLAWEMTKVHKQYSKNQLPIHMEHEISHFVQSLESIPCPVFVVSNETGLGVVPEHASGRAFRDLQGVLNVRLAERSSLTLMLVAGQALLVRNALAPAKEGFLPVAAVTPEWVVKNFS